MFFRFFDLSTEWRCGKDELGLHSKESQSVVLVDKRSLHSLFHIVNNRRKNDECHDPRLDHYFCVMVLDGRRSVFREMSGSEDRKTCPEQKAPFESCLSES